MQERERHHDEAVRPAGAPAGEGNRGAAALERATRLQDHGQALIDRALSGDSQRYLGAIRQRGGQ